MVGSRNIALLMNLDLYYCREPAMGVRRYEREHGPWRICFLEPSLTVLRGLAKGLPLKVDGLLGYFAFPEHEMAAKRIGVSVVNTSSRQKRSILPRVHPDNRAAGRMAAEHLLERGVKEFAFIRQRGMNLSAERLAGFVQGVEGGGHTVTVCEEESDQLMEKLLSLPRPLGILATGDGLAIAVMRRLLDRKIRIPQDMAIMGIDNSELACETADVPLTSVNTNANQVGYTAAAVLDRLLEGDTPKPGPILVPPVGVVARASTDVVPTSDPQIARAVRFLRLHACEPVGVKELLCEVPMSRRSIERRMREVLGRTPYQEIRRLRFLRACELLTGTELRIGAVATRCGYRTPKRFLIDFRQRFHMTPTQYRARRSGT